MTPGTAARSKPGEFLFVYGTLRSDLPDSARPFVSREPFGTLASNAELIGPGTVAGRLYAVAWYPGYVPVRSRRERVAGEVWRLLFPARVFAVLDAYEDNEYVRVRATVRMDGDRRIEAWTYRFAEEVDRAPVIPSGDYLHWLNTPR